MNTRRLSRRSKLMLVSAALGGVLAMTLGTIAVASPERGPKTLRFSGEVVGSTQGLPIDTNANGHMATITKMMDEDFYVESFAETDQLPQGDPDRDCALPDGSTGVLSRIVPGGGQTVWNYPKTESQLWAQVTFRELCVGASTATIRDEAEVIGGFGQFKGATGTIVSTDRVGETSPFRLLGAHPQLTVPQLTYVFVATTAHYEIEITVPR